MTSSFLAGEPGLALSRPLRQDLHGEGEDDRRVLLGRDRVQRLQVAQLQRTDNRHEFVERCVIAKKKSFLFFEVGSQIEFGAKPGYHVVSYD